MSKHTPGPWALELRQTWPFGVRVVAANGREVLSESAYCHSSKQKTREDCENGIGFPVKSSMPGGTQAEAVMAIAEQDANARLIAAAPELLEALEAMVDHFGVLEDNPMLHETAMAASRAARAAIAKATADY